MPLILVSGFASFAYELLWTRLLSHLLGGSIYAFATMLAVFLTGLGLGSAVAARRVLTPERARRGFVVAQLGIAAGSYAAFVLLNRVPELAASLELRAGSFLPSGALLAAPLLLPGAFFIGMTFPCAVRMLAGSASEAGRASARVFAWNTRGAIGGALATGFLLLPTLRIAGTMTAALALSLGLALAAAWLVPPRTGRLVAAALLGLVLLAALPPTTPWQVLRTSPLSGKVAPGEIAYYGVGRSATVLLLEQSGEWRLTTNGLPEAAIQQRGARFGRFTIAHWLGLLPFTRQPEARSLLVVGMGAGLTLEAIPSSVTEIHLVELEPEVVRANRSRAAERRWDPLRDPRLHVYVHDARSALLLTERRYDAIVSQPSHPWTAGASHLFTHEFFTLVADRLEPDGVFVQWIGLRFLDGALLRSLLATLVDVFPYVEAYQPFPRGALLFLCGQEPPAGGNGAQGSLGTGRAVWRRLGISTPEDLLAARVLDPQGARRLGEGAPLNTDQHNLLMSRSPRILRQPLGARGADLLLSDYDPLSRLAADESGLYVVSRLVREKAVHRARRVAGTILDPVERQTARALVHLGAGQRALGEKTLWSALAQRPESEQALHALLLLQGRDLGRRASSELFATGLDGDPPAATVYEGRRLAGVRNYDGIRALEPRLAEIAPSHLLFRAATQLRVAWRQASRDPQRAREALDLLDPLLVHTTQGGRGLLTRARLARLAQDPDAVLASLAELVVVLRRHPDRNLAGEAFRILDATASVPGIDPRSSRLRADLDALLTPGN